MSVSFTKIGNNCFIGPHAVIGRGVTVGDRCLVGANCFLSYSIPKNTIVMGNPAKKTGEVTEVNGQIKIIKL